MKRKLVVYIFALLVGTTFVWAHQDIHDKIAETKRSLNNSYSEKERIDLLCKIADAYYSVNADSGVIYATKALQIANEIDYLDGKIKAHDILGFLNQLLGKFSIASEHFSSALQLAELSNDSVQRINILNHLGVFNYNQNLEKSLLYHIQALQLSKEIKSRRQIAASYNHIGSIYYKQKNYQKALEHNLLSLSEWEKIDSLATAGILSDVGNIYYRLADYSNALKYYERGYQIAKANNDQQSQGFTLSNVGLVLYKQGKKKEALKAFEQSYEHRRSVNSLEGMANSLLNLSLWHLQEKDFKAATKYAEENIAIVSRLGIAGPLYDAANMMVDIYTQQNQYAKALEYQKLLTTYKDSITTAESNTQLARMEVLYELEKKEAENKLLKEQQATAEAIIDRQYITTISIAIILLFAAIGVLLLYRSNRMKNSINVTLQEQNALIEEQKKELENLNGVKDKLFSILTHDLRGPVSSLKMFMSYLRDEELNQQMIKEYTKQSAATMDQIMDLMENVLHWSKSQWKGITIEATKINLYQIIKEKIRLNEQIAKKKNISIHNLIPATAEAYADYQMVDIVFRNILSNAVKFTEENGTIRIRCNESDDFNEIFVEDSGVGMTEEQIQSLFTFHHNTTKGTNEESGTGLGLMLSKEFIEKNGGKLRVESVSGGGSIVSFTLPRTKRHDVNDVQIHV